MEELITPYVLPAGYLLFRVYGWKKTICTLLCRPCVEGKEKETGGTESAAPDAEVMGNTRYVYLDENAGKTTAPFMSLLKGIFIGEEEDAAGRCGVQSSIGKDETLQEVQEDL